mmetsp:Transcript_2659/g.4140  ORF Transcript_2659/g.4140 Transcript_2659/m.4140 type:complete len:459 (+) Transcript_2659:176-1552(+)|eukprot:CAMPEP_0196809686 /NCGR_PEP_ID=MMETSP1362-20130617/9589_1 /TAXON_ID=163516 /ORGANISM="Leptocylindrus danicus, Strain CCMP1856" /LENGTH=458 /DNA_ID=CAMNT_0042184445 /DNA_START=155 /DNA_END=1531 /DNA_ORIENTATION=-
MQEHQEFDYEEAAEERRQALKSAAEAKEIGRATLETLARQKESLERSEAIAEENIYIMDKSIRVLRGMTWSGWVANIFSKDVEPPEASGKHSKTADASSSFPQMCSERKFPKQVNAAVHAMNNYHCNVMILQQCCSGLAKQDTHCDTKQLKLCLQTCKDLHETAESVLDEVYLIKKYSRDIDDVYIWLIEEMKKLVEIERKCETKMREIQSKGDQEIFHRTALFGSPSCKVSEIPAKITSSEKNLKVFAEQDVYLDAITSDIGELKCLGGALHESLSAQNDILNSIDKKSDEVSDKTKMASRRAGRINQKKTFKAVKPNFQSWMTIKYLPTNQYLTQSSDGLVLTDRNCGDASVFGVYKRQGDAIGLQNKLTHKWLGMNIWGNIRCDGSSFGSREEWEIDDRDPSRTYLLCACANWGSGGWIIMTPQKKLISVGSEIENKRKALLWSFTEVKLTEDDS